MALRMGLLQNQPPSNKRLNGRTMAGALPWMELQCFNLMAYRGPIVMLGTTGNVFMKQVRLGPTVFPSAVEVTYRLFAFRPPICETKEFYRIPALNEQILLFRQTGN